MDQQPDEQPDEEPRKRPEREQQLQMIRAYVSRHWRGQNPLVYAFWVNHIIAIILAEIIYGIFLRVFLKLGLLSFAPHAVLQIALLGLYVWSIVGLWRSTSVSIRNARPVRFPFWSYAVRVWLALVAFAVILDVLGMP